MTDRKSIEARIAELRGELSRAEGTPTEVYSRIVGYYRSVRNWNAGKREEYGERLAFDMPVEPKARPAVPEAEAEAAAVAAAVAAPRGPTTARPATARPATARPATLGRRRLARRSST